MPNYMQYWDLTQIMQFSISVWLTPSEKGVPKRYPWGTIATNGTFFILRGTVFEPTCAKNWVMWSKQHGPYKLVMGALK